MAEMLAQWLVQTFGEKIPSWLTVFIISMFPILENRGGMIAARLEERFAELDRLECRNRCNKNACRTWNK